MMAKRSRLVNQRNDKFSRDNFHSDESGKTYPKIIKNPKGESLSDFTKKRCGLFAVVADCVNRAGAFRFFAERDLVVR